MEGLLNSFTNNCCMTPFHKNINLTRFLFREKFVWRGKVLLLANSHKFWYPTLGAIQDLVLQAGATKNPLHQFQTWSHFAFSKISNSSIFKNIEIKYSYKYQTQRFSKISNSEILRNYQTLISSKMRMLKLAKTISNIMKYSWFQILSKILRHKICLALLSYSPDGHGLCQETTGRYLSVNKSPRGPLAPPPSPHLLYIIHRHVTNFITSAGS